MNGNLRFRRARFGLRPPYQVVNFKLMFQHVMSYHDINDIKKDLCRWLNDNVGTGSHYSSLWEDKNHWAWAMPATSYAPIGIYFKHAEDAMLFSLAHKV
jgi:hypothetical protein